MTEVRLVGVEHNVPETLGKIAALEECVMLQCGIKRAADAAAPVVGQWSRRQGPRAELVSLYNVARQFIRILQLGIRQFHGQGVEIGFPRRNMPFTQSRIVNYRCLWRILATEIGGGLPAFADLAVPHAAPDTRKMLEARSGKPQDTSAVNRCAPIINVICEVKPLIDAAAVHFWHGEQCHCAIDPVWRNGHEIHLHPRNGLQHLRLQAEYTVSSKERSDLHLDASAESHLCH